MKEDMFDLENIEKLMLNKSYNDLNELERELINQYINSESEYFDMRETLLNVKKTFQEEKITLRPKPELKDSLLKKFEESQINKNKTPSNTKKLSIPPYYKYFGIAASIVLGLFFAYKFYNQEKNIINQPEIAMNDSKDKTIVNPTTNVPIEELATEITTIHSNDNQINESPVFGTSDKDEMKVLEEQEDLVESSTITTSENKNTTSQKLNTDDIMVSDNEAFYTSPGEMTNMYYEYSKNSGTLKKETNGDLYRNKKDNTSLTQPTKSTKSKIISDEIIRDRDKNEEITKQNNNLKKEITKKGIRKSLIYCDL